LAQDHADEFTIVGVGAFDNFELAQDFVDSTGTESFTMLWGEPDPWRYYGVRRNSTTVVIGADGEVKGNGFGPDLEQIRELIG
jgi:hypothetical protein